MAPIPSSIINLPRMKFNSLEYDNDEIVFYMESDLRYAPICSHCGGKVSPNRNLNRRVRDLGCFGFLDSYFFLLLFCALPRF